MNSKNIEEEFYRTHNVFHKLNKNGDAENLQEQESNKNLVKIFCFFNHKGH